MVVEGYGALRKGAHPDFFKKIIFVIERNEKNCFHNVVAAITSPYATPDDCWLRPIFSAGRAFRMGGLR
jgi:hypothetical protein